MGSSGVAADVVQVVLHPGGIDAELFGDSAVGSSEVAGIDDLVEVGELHPGLLQVTGNGLGDELAIAFITNPALFPHIIEILACPLVVVDKIRVQGIAALELGNDIVVTEEQRRGTVSGEHLGHGGHF